MRMTEVRNMPKITRPIEANPGVSDFQAHVHGPTMLCFGRGRGHKEGRHCEKWSFSDTEMYTPGRMIRRNSVGMRKGVQISR